MSRAIALTAGVICGFLVAGLAFAGSTARKPRQAPAGPKPGEPVFVINGRGWGHGVGMSQWGANGFARKGWSYDRILAHYYRGTAIGDAPVSKVRVLLAAGKRRLDLASAAPFRVRDATGKVKALAAGPLTLGPGLKILPKGGKKKIALTAPLTFLPGQEPLRLGRRYRGSIRVDLQKGRLRAINVVGLEQYLYGVVPSEVPDDWPAEVLKAQAVAARSYALATRKTDGDFDLYPDVRSQVYRGIDEEVETTTAAVDGTAGEVLTYGGQLALTYFFSTSGGKTASVTDVFVGSKPIPYLVSVDDPYDSLSPHHIWGPLVFPVSRLQKAIKAPGRLTDVRTMVNRSSRVSTVTGVGTLGQVTMRGSDVRRVLDLRSTWFRVGVLALPVPTKPIAYGSAGKLTGTARGLAKVVLEQQSGSTWRSVAQVQPVSGGAFTVTVRPTTTAVYRLAAGTARTAPTRVLVAPQVALSPVTDAMELRGSVKPLLAGAGVEVQKLSGRTWQTVGRATVDARGDFSARIYVPPGSYRAVVPTPGRGLVAGTSSTLVVSG
ncbi:MAG TPA: SpoIID/LytB domain-containing protein [Gaiellaceae bacterium]|nr:SpoIID/LytB domain-containing protein [Gaiellaceae bacterium]